MHPQLIIVHQHQADLRAEVDRERRIRSVATMDRGSDSRLPIVTRGATLVRRVARGSRPAPLGDTVTTA
jgi:hypothetical protein